MINPTYWLLSISWGNILRAQHQKIPCSNVISAPKALNVKPCQSILACISILVGSLEHWQIWRALFTWFKNKIKEKTGKVFCPTQQKDFVLNKVKVGGVGGDLGFWGFFSITKEVKEDQTVTTTSLFFITRNGCLWLTNTPLAEDINSIVNNTV